MSKGLISTDGIMQLIFNKYYNLDFELKIKLVSVF
jgi:hypothetical protein